MTLKFIKFKGFQRKGKIMRKHYMYLCIFTYVRYSEKRWKTYVSIQVETRNIKGQIRVIPVVNIL